MPNSSKTSIFKRRWLWAVIFLLTLIGVASLSVPKIAHQQITQSFRDAGFTHFAYEEKSNLLGMQEYRNIRLDEDGFSAIESLRILYNPFQLVLFKQLHSVRASNISLTGELARDGIITLAGWSAPDTPWDQIAPPLGRVSVQNFNIDLLTDFMGGISARLDGDINTGKSPAPFQVRLRSRQRYLSIDTNIQGQIDAQHNWQASFELLRAKFEVSPFKATRMSGLGRGSGQALNIHELSGELHAGGLNLYGFPWREASAGFAQTADGLRTLQLGAHSVGENGVEMSADIKYQQNGLTVSGLLYSDNSAALNAYTQKNGLNLSEYINSENTGGLELLFSLENPLDPTVTFLYTLRIPDDENTVLHEGVFTWPPQDPEPSSDQNNSAQ